MQNDNYLRGLFESDMIGIIYWDLDGSIIDANDKFLKMVGFSRQDLIAGKINWKELTPPEYQELDRLVVKQLKTTGKSIIPLEKEYICKDGSRISVLLAGVVLEAKSQGVSFVLDITEQKKTELLLKKSEEKFEKIFRKSPVAKALAEVDGYNITDINYAFEVLYGCSRNEIIGKPFDLLQKAEIIEHINKDKPVRDLELNIKIKDGLSRTVLFSIEYIEIDSREHLLLVIRDITEHKHIELKLARAIEYLKHSNTELEQFAYTVSHDLQEPLRIIRSYVNLFVKKYVQNFNEEARQYLDFISESAARMAKLVDNILKYSRAVNKVSEFERIDCNLVLKNVLDDLRLRISEENADVSICELPIVTGDLVQLYQLFYNIILNALKFRSKKTPEIRVECARLSDYWQFSIKDNGIGIDSRFHDKIFLIFQRVDENKEFPGAGIGLALCKKIVERHGGKIFVESVQNEGSVFHFTLPVSSQQ